MESKRNEIVDFYKGILMWGVILGHTITALKGGLDVGPIFIHTFLRTYDMPFFMILSGFFLSKSLQRHGTKYVLINRITMILCPILFWNIITGNIHFSSFYFLWAIFASSLICMISFIIENVLNGKRLHIEMLLEIVFAFMLYFVNVPWNLFYLYPFFILGRYLNNIEFKLPNFALCFLSFVLFLCFWKGKYSPWIIGAEAWKTDELNIVIYVYRFLLGIIGTFVIANILNFLFIIKWGGKKYIVKSGSQTLAIYILQSIVVEKYLGKIMRLVVNIFDINYNDSMVNVIGYVIAPILSLSVMLFLSYIIDKLDTYKYTQKLFGFKLSL